MASEIDLAQVRLAELVAALSLGIYLGFGQPMAASSLLLPRWGGLARFAAGLVCLGVSAWQDGLGPASAGLAPFVAAQAPVQPRACRIIGFHRPGRSSRPGRVTALGVFPDQLHR